MNPIDEKIRDRQRLRVQILEVMYGAVNGNTNAIVAQKGLSEDLGIDLRELSYEIEFLASERLLGFHGPQGVRLTHEGIREVEELHARPDEPTQHFVAYNVMNIGSMVSSQINQGSPAANQTTNSAPSPVAQMEQMLQRIQHIEGIAPEQHSELVDAAGHLLALLRSTTT